jgi:hypothetical protein
MTGKDYGVGRGRPPQETRFKKGESGNPGGRPKGRKPAQVKSAFDVLFDITVPATADGVGGDMSLEESLEQTVLRKAFDGHRPSIRKMLAWIEQYEEALGKRAPAAPAVSIRREADDPSNADAAMLLLGIAERTQIFSGEALQLHPWVVEAAKRRRRSPLSQEDAQTVARSTLDLAAQGGLLGGTRVQRR